MSLSELMAQAGPAPATGGLLQQVAGAVQQVETVLDTLVASPVRTVETVGRHTLEAGGKRLRPAFVLLAARATGLPFDPDRAARLGACLELVHMATLIHDDVIDHSAARRGRPTAASVYGNTASILSGDVMLARSMVVLADDGDLDIIRAVAGSVVEMAEGEAREVETRGDFDLLEVDHRAILRMKTAAFVECCCRVGALAAGAPEHAASLAAYGHHVGMAFQLADDLLDYRGDSDKTGKPQATDFREGCATLPLIFLRETLSEEETRFTRRKFGNGVTDDEVHMIGQWMESRGAYTRAEAAAQAESAAAHEALMALPPSPARDVLAAVALYVVQRQA